MTGTATPHTEKVIINNLLLPSETKIIRQPSNRPSILYHVRGKKSDGMEQIVSLIKKEHPDRCGIVYCTERKDTVETAYHLKTAGVVVMSTNHV